MITNEHNDGCCFKMVVNYWNDQDHEEERRYIMYGEDEDELWEHYVEVRHLFLIVESIIIMDDSK